MDLETKERVKNLDPLLWRGRACTKASASLFTFMCFRRELGCVYDLSHILHR